MQYRRRTTCNNHYHRRRGVLELFYFASAVVAAEFNPLTTSSSASCRIVRPHSVSGQEFTILSMVWSPRKQIDDFVSPHLYMEALHGMWGNGSTVTMNNEVGQSLAVVRWGPQLLHSWLLKLIVSFLSTVSSCLQKTNPIRWDAVMKVAVMGDRKHQLELASCDGCLYYAASTADFQGRFEECLSQLSRCSQDLWR